jgi:hypothetical protein
MRLKEIGQLKKSNDPIGYRTRHLPACSIVPQPTTLPRAPHTHVICELSPEMKRDSIMLRHQTCGTEISIPKLGPPSLQANTNTGIMPRNRRHSRLLHFTAVFPFYSTCPWLLKQSRHSSLCSFQLCCDCAGSTALNEKPKCSLVVSTKK